MRYSSGIAFRQALEQRLKIRAAGQEARLVRDRKRVAFDRLLARLAATAPDRWLLKGGFALDLRLATDSRFSPSSLLDSSRPFCSMSASVAGRWRKQTR
jgi:hypothetical protein